jgi:hypothetical protein
MWSLTTLVAMRPARRSCMLLASVLLTAISAPAQVQVEQQIARKVAAILATARTRAAAREAIDNLAKEGLLSRAGVNVARPELEAIFSQPKPYFAGHLAGSILTSKANQDFSQLGDDAFRTLVVAQGRARAYLTPDDRSVLQLLEAQNAKRPQDQRLGMTLSDGKLHVNSPSALVSITVDMQAFKAYIARLAMTQILSDIFQPSDRNGSR